MYTLNNISGYCPSKMHTMIRLEEDNQYKSCGVSKNLIHLLFSTGLVTTFDMPANIYSTFDLITYLKYKGYV